MVKQFLMFCGNQIEKKNEKKKKKNRPFLPPTPLKKNVNSSKGTKCMSFEMKNNELLENY